MELQVQRKCPTKLSTIGELSETVPHQSDTPVQPFHCFTLEPPIRHDGAKPRAIPAGRYRVTWRYSPRHSANVPHVEDVPGFSEIEIHAGNFPHDTEGCTLVAQSYSPTIPDFIGHSDPARDALYRLIEQVIRAGEEIWITYIDPPEPLHAVSTSSAESTASTAQEQLCQA